MNSALHRIATQRPTPQAPDVHDSARAHVQGTAPYIDDQALSEGTAHAAPVMSPVAHGRIEHIDWDWARQQPGVLAVVTAQDIPGDPVLASYVHDEAIFATDTVSHHGQVLGLIVASDHLSARRVAKAMPVLKVRAKDLNELAANAAFLFAQRPLAMEEKAAALLTDDARALLGQVKTRIEAENDWTLENLETSLKAMAEELGLGLGKLAQPLRAALTGQTTSPGIFDVLVLLGRDESLARIAAQSIPAGTTQV